MTATVTTANTATATATATASAIATGVDTATPLAATSFLVAYPRLFLSPNNVRAKKCCTVESVRALAAMIEADGLLADLQVSAERGADGTPTGRYAVEAGGRRWRAIGLLISEKRLPGDVAVSCRLVAEGRATGVSLAENISQERIHPADEFAAFAKLIAEGKAVEDVARHFGVQVIDVQRRMKLAKVAPALVAQFRQNEITLDQMMALATTDDTKRQIAVWKALPEYQRSASSIRRRLTENEVSAGDPRVKLIGLDRYKASGGTLRQDLFTEDSFLEAGLVDLIAAEVLAEAVDRVEREGWAWVAVFETMGYEERQRFASPPTKYLPESEAVRKQREAMEAQLDTLEAQYGEAADDDEGGDDSDEQSRCDTLDQECNTLRAKIDALRTGRVDTIGYDKATLGAVVTTEAGVLQIQRGVMLAKDAKAEAQRQSAVAHGEPAHAGAGFGSGKSAAAAEYSEKLMADLTSHRTAAMQAAASADVPVALAALADSLCAQVLFHGYRTGSILQISLKQCGGTLALAGTAMAESKAAHALQAQRDAWEAVVPADSAERLAWLLRQPQATVLALLAFCAASSIDVVARRATPNPQADAMATGLRLDLGDWWSPGVDNFLAHVSKAKIAAVVTKACGAGAAAPIAAMKKADACAKAAELLAGTGWLPAPLRATGAAVSLASVMGSATVDVGLGDEPGKDAQSLADPEVEKAREADEAEFEAA